MNNKKSIKREVFAKHNAGFSCTSKTEKILIAMVALYGINFRKLAETKLHFVFRKIISIFSSAIVF